MTEEGSRVNSSLAIGQHTQGHPTRVQQLYHYVQVPLMRRLEQGSGTILSAGIGEGPEGEQLPDHFHVSHLTCNPQGSGIVVSFGVHFCAL